MDQETLKIRHTKSLSDFPHLNLEDDEYVELEFTRATICLVLIWVVSIFLGVLLSVLILLLNSKAGSEYLMPGTNATAFLNIAGIVFGAILVLAALISTRVHRGNRLYVTNKRAIQYIMISLFGSSINIIDLGSIEDVSFKQSGVLDFIFGIGTIRMSTVGDETTYTFKRVYKPSAKEMQLLTGLVSKAKKKQDKD